MACCLPFLFNKKDTQNVLDKAVQTLEMAGIVMDVVNKDVKNIASSETKILDEVLNQVMDKSVEVIYEKVDEVVASSVNVLVDTTEAMTEAVAEAAHKVEAIAEAIAEAVTEAATVTKDTVENVQNTFVETTDTSIVRIEQKNEEERLKVKEAVRSIVREAVGAT